MTLRVTRRELLQGAALVGASLALPRVGRAQAYVPRPNATQYALAIATTTANPDNAQAVPGVLLNGAVPGPEIRVREGELLRVLVENRLDETPTSIHWHGILVPAGMDGVPDVSNAPIAARQAYVYEYPIRQSGTYWYHSHYDFQEQLGCYGAFIIEPAHEPVRSDRDAVVLLADWLHRSPLEVFEELRSGKQQKDGPSTPGVKMDGMKMGGGADLSDVKYDAFLLNGRAAADPWTLPVRPGERVRLRLINGGSSTYFRIRLDDHPLEITHADGLAVEPVTVDHLLIGMGETYDAIVTIKAAGSYTLHAVAQDGSGQAIGVMHTDAAQPNRSMPNFDGRGLDYTQLRAVAPTTLPEGPVKTFRLPLQGNMANYVWMIDGQAWPKADPLRIRRGDRVRIEMVNQTMMWHPMHLHGHFFRVLQGAGERCPLKHTVNVAPQQTVQIEFTADNPGNWFFHCHNAYHLEAGMARVIQYET